MSIDLTNVGTIKQILQKHGLAPQRRFGQNFLIDRTALDKIVAAADLKPNDIVLEIGPGLGVLTRELCQKVKKVVAVELDKTMVEILKETTSDCQNLEIVQGDILKTEFKIQNSKFKITSNLPYNITSAVLRKFLSNEPKPSEIVVLVQKEVAERITASPGGMSLLSVSVQFYGQPEIVDFVSKNSFWPSPEVDSAILKISEIGNGFSKKMSAEEEKRFFQIVKFGFSSRRKQLQNNLAVGLKMENQKIKEMLEKIGLNPRIRAQDLSIENWLKLVKETTN